MFCSLLYSIRSRQAVASDRSSRDVGRTLVIKTPYVYTVLLSLVTCMETLVNLDYEYSLQLDVEPESPLLPRVSRAFPVGKSVRL